MSIEGNPAYLSEFEQMVSRHLELIENVISPEKRTQTIRLVQENFTDLVNIFRGIFLIKDISIRITDTIVSYGEVISSIIVSHLIQGRCTLMPAILSKQTISLTNTSSIFPLPINLYWKRLPMPPGFIVCGGFISTDAKAGYITNLGRGGSDYTAAILASALNATKLEIWTDVDGFMTADQIISNTYTIERLSFSEATELCNFGAKVIYPPTIFPVYHKNIPVEIKNTFNPEATGTYISSDKDTRQKSQQKAIKGISSINDTSLITIQGLGMVGVIGVNYRIFRVLAKNGLDAITVGNSNKRLKPIVVRFCCFFPFSIFQYSRTNFSTL